MIVWLLLETFECFSKNVWLLLKVINERLLLKEKMCFLEITLGFFYKQLKILSRTRVA